MIGLVIVSHTRPSNLVVEFAVDPKSGKLSPITATTNVGAPAAIAFASKNSRPRVCGV